MLPALSVAFLLAASPAAAQDFAQPMLIDTSRNFLRTTPDLTEAEARKRYEAFEADLVTTRKLDLAGNYYLLFRYRDPFFTDIFRRFALSDSNPVLRLWACNALEQIEDKGNPETFRILAGSANPMIREMAANAFSFFGKRPDLPFLAGWLAEEKNGYVAETLRATLEVVRRGGYRDLFPYLPQLYENPIKRLKFFLNKRIVSKSGMSREFEFRDTPPGGFSSPSRPACPTIPSCRSIMAIWPNS